MISSLRTQPVGTVGKALHCGDQRILSWRGLELAMACLLRIALEKARLGMPEWGLGFVPGNGVTQLLIRLVGMGNAAKIILTARKQLNLADLECDPFRKDLDFRESFKRSPPRN